MKKLSVEKINELKMTALEEADPEALVNPVTEKWNISTIVFSLKPGAIVWDDPDYETIFQDGETDGWQQRLRAGDGGSPGDGRRHLQPS